MVIDFGRRQFIFVLGGAIAWPLAARAQQAERTRQVGVLVPLAEDDPDMKADLVGFREGLARLGWSEGRNISIDARFGGGNSERIKIFAKELVALKPDVILAQSTSVAATLQQETRAIPIVFVNVSDPIGSGFIASLARPGGNLTGLQLYEEGIIGKWLAMLKEIAPNLARAALIANPKTTPFEYFQRSAQSIVHSLAIELVPIPVENAADIERAIESFARIPDGGMVLPPDSTITFNRELIVTLAARYRLPAVYSSRFFVAEGGLMSYGTLRRELSASGVPCRPYSARRKGRGSSRAGPNQIRNDCQP